FYDRDENGIYEPVNGGDYPLYDIEKEVDCRLDRTVTLFGDQTIWWVMNDKGNIHRETEGDAIGVEIHGQEFAFATNDEINNMTFTNYRIINRSTFTLIDTYFGTNFDPDLGDPTDDFAGCDVERGLGYVYNGVAIDGTGAPGHYGANPPAIGVDFFEGPFQDADGLDNASGGCDASINGLNFGDDEIDNERWGMRRFIYYNNGGCVTCGPTIGVASQYYNLLKGFWKDGTEMTYGGTGYGSGVPANFMFPGDTDPCGWGTGSNPQPGNWTEQGENNVPSDRRFIHSAGPFTLEPGAQNDITVGIVWARSNSSNPFESVELVRLADDKAQALFDNCFRVLDGPDAPALAIQEMDQSLIIYLTNPKFSNNALEGYHQVDPLIVEPGVDNEYRFQGYQIFQLKNADISITDISDVEKARLVAQVDIKDSIGKIVNIELNQAIGAEVPELMVDGNNRGIRHTFYVTEDLFADGDKRLVNHKKYYFIALSYAYNQYTVSTTDPLNPTKDGNKKPYLASRKNGSGASISSVMAIPHQPQVENYGTVLNSVYGDGPEIIRYEGQGNGGKVLELSQATISAIMSDANWRVDQLTYTRRNGPIDVKVIDPLSVKGGEYQVKFYYDIKDTINIELSQSQHEYLSGDNFFQVYRDLSRELALGDKIHVNATNFNDGTYTVFGFDSSGTKIYVEETIAASSTGGYINPFYRWVLVDATNLSDTVYKSYKSTRNRNEEIIANLGISITIEQINDPGPGYAVPLNLASPVQKAVLAGGPNPDPNNGFLESSMTFSDPNQRWLTGVADGDVPNAMNWIRSGSALNPIEHRDYFVDNIPIDEHGSFENIIGGTWAPYRLASKDTNGPAFDYKNNNRVQLSDLASVDLIITTDRSKWTRAVVLEMQESPEYTRPIGSNVAKLGLRAHMSVDKNGKSVAEGSSSANFDGFDTGMGWFPGYAINIETGERLNIMFGEDSWLVNGDDMIWNPTSDLTSGIGKIAIDDGNGQPGVDGIPFWAGGKHFIYIIGHNADDTTKVEKGHGDMPNYDEGKYIRSLLGGSPSDARKNSVFKDVMWVGLPMLKEGFEISHPGDIPSDVKIRLRVSKPYRQNYSTGANALVSPQNDNHPLYGFNLDEFAVETRINSAAIDALDEINVVPNPYLGFNTYETNQLDHRIKIINLPVECTVSIYSLNGTLIRQFRRDDQEITSIDWDLKNSKNVPVASGVYLIHVKAPDIGEKVVKWFGSLRPVDLDSF
ncbi:MAG: hypothetical protein COB85_06780, partial [Bacteroidetes bacterium]